jgi:hypothetical protein
VRPVCYHAMPRATTAIPVAVLAALAFRPTPACGQESVAPRVFLDCQGFRCDFDHLRREIEFVNWVRDRQDAQVHVLATTQRTGSGGREYTLTFIGLGRYEGRVDTLSFASSQTDTDAEVRDQLTRTLALGLVHYAAATPLASRLTVAYQAADGSHPGGPVRDPWNFWVFRMRLGGAIDGESQQNQQSANGSVSASLVTQELKLDFVARGSYDREKFEYTTDAGIDTSVVSTSRNWSVEGMAAWSLGQHAAWGARAEVGASTYFNRSLDIEAGPVVEFSVFPYDESTRRALTFQLSAEIGAYRYDELTIFDRTSEVRPLSVADVGFSQRQPWGSVRGSASWVQYWHDLSRHRLEFFAGMDIRLVRGLALNLNGNFARVKDQLYLPAAELSPEEILLRRRQLGTDYRYRLNLGFSFTFGSIYNNVVNPRIDN